MPAQRRPRAAELSVRRAVGADWTVVRDVRLGSLAESPRMFGSSLERELGFDEATWRRRSERTALAWLADRAVGIAAYHWTQPGISADLVSMWVSPTARGTGAADALVQWVIHQVVDDQHAELELGVVDDNAIAIAVYRRNDFHDIGTTVGLHSGSSLLRMRYAPR